MIVAAVAIGLQASAPAAMSGITVEGTGTADAVVHVVKVSLYARALNVDEGEYLRAMRTAGLTDPVIPAHLPDGSVTLRGTFSDATAARLEAVRLAAEAFVTAHGGVLTQTQFVGAADECPAIEARARVNAADDARGKMQAEEARAGVRSGPPVSINESGGCPLPGEIGGASLIDPVSLKMQVTVKEAVTSAVGEQSAAAPVVSVRGVGGSEGAVHNVKIRVFARDIGATNDDILAALRAAGVRNPDFGAAVKNAPLVLRGSIDNATPASIAAVSRAIDTFVTAHNGVIGSVAYYGSSEECPAIEVRARAVAMEDALRRARAAATLAGGSVGAPIAVNESGGCPQLGPQGGAMTMNPYTMNMRITIAENVTYAATLGSH